MARIRSNHRRTEKFRSRLYAAHNRAAQIHMHSDALISERAAILQEARLVSTREEISFLHGFADALWLVTARDMEWRLGRETGPVPRNHVWPAGYSPGNGGPTHGGHFWRGTDRPWNDWKPLSAL